MKPHSILAALLLLLAALSANAQQKKEIAQWEEPQRVSTNSIHKNSAHKLEKHEGRVYSNKEPRVVNGVKLSKKEWKKRNMEQNFESKPYPKPQKEKKNKTKPKSAKK